MNKIVLFLIFLFVCDTYSLLGQQREVYLITDLLYDSEQNALVRNKVVHIKGNEILNIGEEDIIPENAEKINLKGYTILPGLIDAHTHVLFSQEPDEDFAEGSINTLTRESEALRTLRGAERAESYLKVGITSIKDLGNSGLFLDVALRDAINEGTIAGPRIFASGPIMAASGGQIYGVSHQHQDLIDLEYRIIENIEDGRNAVREHMNQHVDLIKICADNIPNNTRLTRDEMKTIVQTAHSYELTVTAHSITNQSAWEAVQAGVDGIEHGFFLADSILSVMAEKDIFLVPTENSRSYMNTYYKLAGTSPEELHWIDSYLKNMENRLSRAIDKGVTIIAGSDNYTDIKVSRGTSSKDMFRAYFEAGMKPLDILRSATYLSALHMNKEKEIGVLRPGAKADIIAIKGDLQNDFPEAIENIVFVMKGGKVYMDKTE